MAVNIFNAVTLSCFCLALCWRIDRIRREPKDTQSIAITTAVAAVTLAFVVINRRVANAVDQSVFTGASRLAFYCLLAIGVAALVVAFFFGSSKISRRRRAGMEAIPLVVAMIGLHLAMLMTPTPVRTENISWYSARNLGFSLFFIIAGGYLTYGLTQCARSVLRYVRLAIGPLRVALIVNMLGLSMLGLATLSQTVFVIGSLMRLWNLPALLHVATILSGAGVVFFLIGICYPMIRSGLVGLLSGRRRRRDLERMRPLWELVTSALPEVILPDEAMSSDLRYRRRVIEIRDALSQLSPLLSEDFDQRGPQLQAEELRAAVATVCDSGIPTGTVRTILEPSGAGLEEDAAPMIRLADAIRGAVRP